MVPSAVNVLCTVLSSPQSCSYTGPTQTPLANAIQRDYQFYIKRVDDVFVPQSQVYQRNARRQGTTNLMKPTDIGDMMMVLFTAMLITLPTTSGTVSRERLEQ